MVLFKINADKNIALKSVAS